MNTTDSPARAHELDAPDIEVSVRQVFGLDSDMVVPAFSVGSDYVPDLDETYVFDHETTMAILAGFGHNRRVMIQGYHGTGKSTHVEQVAARLNWPCIRVNLDSHISRIDLIGKDAIVSARRQAGHRIPRRHSALGAAEPVRAGASTNTTPAARRDVRDPARAGDRRQADAARSRTVIRPHKCFRLFATANTVGLGDTTGLYHGTQQINQGQMDRWNIRHA